MRNFAIASVACFMLTFGAFAIAEEKEIDNPQYVTWSKCGKGTSVTLESTSEMEMKNVPKQKPTVSTLTYTLVSVAPEKCVVEMAMTGYKANQDVPAKIKVDTSAKGAKAPNKTGSESVKAGDGKEYKCDVYETEMDNDQNGMKSHTSSKTWMCSDVPGGTVKSDTTTKSDMMTSHSVTLLKSFDKK